MRKIIVLKNEGIDFIGTFSIENDLRNWTVSICIVRDGIEMRSKFFFKKDKNPKVCMALDKLKRAMMEEGADILTVTSGSG